jgi:hypothetical protein
MLVKYFIIGRIIYIILFQKNNIEEYVIQSFFFWGKRTVEKNCILFLEENGSARILTITFVHHDLLGKTSTLTRNTHVYLMYTIYVKDGKRNKYNYL